MRDYEIFREASDPDRTDPVRAVASFQGIAAAWLLVLAAAFIALLPCVVNVAEAKVVRTAHVARSEIVELLRSVPSSLQPRHPLLSLEPRASVARRTAAMELGLGGTL
jgi:hypothetical protein